MLPVSFRRRSHSSSLAILAVLTITATADADDDDDDDDDDDTDARCQRGIDAAQAPDSKSEPNALPNALIDVESCLANTSGLTDDVRVRAKKARRKIERRIRLGVFAQVSIEAEPAGTRIQTAALRDPVVAPTTIYLAPGQHTLRATYPNHHGAEQTLVIDEAIRVPILFKLVRDETAETGAGELDFSAEPPPAAMSSRQQRARKFKSLLPEKLARGAPKEQPPIVEPNHAATWPWIVVGIGVGALAAGVAVHIVEGERSTLATSFYIGGAATTMIGLGALVF